MFGFFNKTKQIRTLTGLLLLQNDILKGLVNILRDMNGKTRPVAGKTTPDAICGEWTGKGLGICLWVRKEKDNEYYASLREINAPTEDHRESFPVREYNGMCYFVLGSYAIFMEHDRNKNRINLCGNLSLVHIAADTASCPAIPLDFNPN